MDYWYDVISLIYYDYHVNFMNLSTKKGETNHTREKGKLQNVTLIPNILSSLINVVLLSCGAAVKSLAQLLSFLSICTTPRGNTVSFTYCRKQHAVCSISYRVTKVDEWFLNKIQRLK